MVDHSEFPKAMELQMLENSGQRLARVLEMGIG